MPSKSWYLSKTLWANALLLLLDILNGVYGAVEVPSQAKIYIVLVVNVVLRFLTDRAIGK